MQRRKVYSKNLNASSNPHILKSVLHPFCWHSDGRDACGRRVLCSIGLSRYVLEKHVLPYLHPVADHGAASIYEVSTPLCC